MCIWTLFGSRVWVRVDADDGLSSPLVPTPAISAGGHSVMCGWPVAFERGSYVASRAYMLLEIVRQPQRSPGCPLTSAT